MKVCCPRCQHEFIRTEEYGINVSMSEIEEVNRVAKLVLSERSGEYISASRLVEEIHPKLKNKVSVRNIPRILKKYGFIFDAETKWIEGKARRAYQIK